MTTKERILISKSWEEVSQNPQVILDFYARLFEIAPDTKKHFPEDLTKQSEKLAYTLGFVVGNLDRLDIIKESVEDLGRTHNKLGIRPEEYGFVKEALIDTIDKNLVTNNNSEILAAWDGALTVIATWMINAPQERKKRTTLWERLFGSAVS